MSDPTASNNTSKIVIVTGGASGIGLAISQHFAGLKHRVVIFDVDNRDSKDIVSLVQGEHKDATVKFHKCSVTEWDDLAAAFKSTYDEFGSIDIVFANAGISEQVPTKFSRLAKEPTKPDLKVLDVNLTGVIYTTRLAGYYISKNTAAEGQMKGSIICTASMSGIYPFSLSPLYSTSKFAVVGLVRSLGSVLLKQEIQINALAPAVLDTNILPDKDFLSTMRVTPMSTLLRGVMKFLDNPSLTGEIAEIHGETVDLRPPHDILDDHEKDNLDRFQKVASMFG